MKRFASSPAYLNGLPPTGQTTVYVAGDNGMNQTGIPHRYELLVTGQYSGTVNIVMNGKTNVKNVNVVIDHQYKLMWSRTTSASVGPTSNGLVPWTTNVNNEGVFPYCTLANAAAMSGHTDWRIPIDNELVTLRNMQGASAVPDPAFFTGFAASTVWSSTTCPNASTFACLVNFISGTMPATAKTTTGLVLLVRSI